MEAMVYDYSKLKGRIKEKFNTQKSFADAMHISSQTISYKVNNNVEWTQAEIDKAITLLDIPAEEIHVYFFAKKVENNSTIGGNTTNDC